jgi:hypothetical protein
MFKAIDTSKTNNGVAVSCVSKVGKSFTGYACRNGMVEFVSTNADESKVRNMLKKAGYPYTKKMVPCIDTEVQVFSKA